VDQLLARVERELRAANAQGRRVGPGIVAVRIGRFVIYIRCSNCGEQTTCSDGAIQCSGLERQAAIVYRAAEQCSEATRRVLLQ
jgi:hypothetical protein